MSKIKLAQLRLICIILICHLLMCRCDVIPADTEDEVATSERRIKEGPIVIHTQQQQYDQPTLDEYQQCHENLDNCKRVCESAKKRAACEAECPLCPLLFNHEIVVQGINDTAYPREAPISALNTTNIIRLTNEIRNVLENNMGNITANNVNNIQVHNNVSTTGGRFGLGYNEQGSCCLVVRPTKHCSDTKFATASRCHQKRLRVCGERCKARVMYAHRERYCNEADLSDCHMRMKYVPHPLHTPHRALQYHTRRVSRCHYQPMWPFVACGAAGGCQRCLQLSYGYILQHGVPESCIHCYRAPPRYGRYDAPRSHFYDYGESAYVGWGDENSDLDADGYDGAGGIYVDDNDWQITKKKCRSPDGSIIDCNGSPLPEHKDNEGIVDENEIVVDEENDKTTPEDPYQTVDDDYDDEYLGGVEAERYRRHALHKRLAFQPSIYSKRHQKQ